MKKNRRIIKRTLEETFEETFEETLEESIGNTIEKELNIKTQLEIYKPINIPIFKTWNSKPNTTDIRIFCPLISFIISLEN